MSVVGLSSPARWRIAGARLRQHVGWAGLAGLLVGALSVAPWLFAWTTGQRVAALQETPRKRMQSVPPAEQLPTSRPRSTLRLMTTSDTPLLLTRIERAFTANGLPWASAEYAAYGAQGDVPARLEVRFAAKAAYPALRASIGDLLGSVPGATFRELAFSRPSSTAAEVEARMLIVVHLLDDGSAPSR